MNATVLATCITCDGALALKQAAIAAGYSVTMETVKRSDARTRRSAAFGIGLPVIVRDDGAVSDDAKEWLSENQQYRTKVTHPLTEVIDNAVSD